MNAPSHQHRCPECGRQFRDPNALWQHAKTRHGKTLAEGLRPPREENKQSMGSLVAEAHLARACGEPVDAWIAEMFDV